jgi:hypothetical protein
MGKDSYHDLIFQLGDLAREHLVKRDDYPRSMDRVFKAEEAVLARREELEQLEAELNEEDSAYKEYVAALKDEQITAVETVRRFQKAVDAIQGKAKDLRKKITATRNAIKYDKATLAKLEQRHADLEMTQPDDYKLDESRAMMKRIRLALMRKKRDLEELQIHFDRVLTPAEGSRGAPGVLAHRRLLEMEDEAEDRKAAYEERIAELDRLIAEKEKEIEAAEDFLDQALFLLGEDCYKQRIADPRLAALYPRIDRAELD